MVASMNELRLDENIKSFETPTCGWQEMMSIDTGDDE